MSNASQEHSAQGFISPYSINQIKYFTFEREVYQLAPELKLAYGLLAALSNKRKKKAIMLTSKFLNEKLGMDTGAGIISDFLRIGVLTAVGENEYIMSPFMHNAVPDELHAFIGEHVDIKRNALFYTSLSPIAPPEPEAVLPPLFPKENA